MRIRREAGGLRARAARGQRVPSAYGGERPVMVASMFRGVRRLGSREFCKNPAKLREIAGFG